MRAVGSVALAFAVFVAGCSDDVPPAETASESDQFDDLGVEATETKGVLLGVVVDDAIRPIQDAKVALGLPDGTSSNKTTDQDGRFAYGDLEPGVYLVEVSSLQYTSVRSAFNVSAGEKDPPVHRIQIMRLFSQQPYTELTNYDGFISCAYAFFVSSTCANDYTRVAGCLDPAACVCPGGCLRDQEVANTAGNRREYVSSITQGWQSIIFEMTWDPTSDAGKELGFTVSYYSRPDTGHWFGSTGGENPLRLQEDAGVEDPDASYSEGQPPMIPVNGTDELFVFFSSNQGSVAVNQGFRSYQTVYYWGIPEEGWSFVAGDPRPF